MPCVHELYRDADISRGPVPAEAIAYWRKKGLRPSFSYKDVFGKEHEFAFAVAKIMREDVLESLSSELDRAIEQGVPFREWMKQIEPRMQAVGWWAPHEVTDPETGKVARVNPPQRLKLIFDTNMRTARAAGQYERIQRQAKTRPYILYQLGPTGSSGRHREQHVAWHGILLPTDDDFWSYAMPPNGWNCFPAGTPVLTASGWRPIETVARGELVVNGAGELQPVRGVHAKPLHGHVVRLAGEWGSVAATPNHRFLTVRGWVRSENLKRGDVLVQLPELPALDPKVGQVDESHSRLSNVRMSLPRKRESSMGEALNAKRQRRDEYVYPVLPESRVMHAFNAAAAQGVQHGLFVDGGRGAGIDMSGRVGTVAGYAVGAHFSADLVSPSGGGRFELFGRRPDHGAVLLGLAKPDMTILGVVLGERGARPSHLGGPARVITVPLPTDRFAMAASGDAEVLHQPSERPPVQPDSLADLVGVEPIDLVQDPEGFTSGAPLDRFDTLDDFAAWARLHCQLQVVDNVTTEPYCGEVYNLTVDGESYVVQAGITHNCRCGVRSVSAREADTLDKEGVLSPYPVPILDDEGLPTGHVEQSKVPVIRKAPDLPLVPWYNDRTGRTEFVPKGIDPGFHHTPGRNREIALAPKA